MHAENDLLDKNVNTEASAKAIHELQEQLNQAVEDKRSVEMEFIALKKNFYNLRDDLDKEKVRTDNMDSELDNFTKKQPERPER
jgi:chromosome segregation ATPase